MNLLLLNFRCYCLDIGLDILKLNELTVSCSLMSSLIAAKQTGHMITATYEAECPPCQLVFLLSACQHNQRYPSHYESHHQPTHSSPILVLHTTSIPTAHLSSYTLQKRTVTHYWPAFILLAGLHLVRIAHLPSFSLLANISYRLLVCGHFFHWPTSHTHCSFPVILLSGQHLVRVARLSSFATLAYSYALVVCPHSPGWPTYRSGYSLALILHAGLLLVCVSHLSLFSSLTYTS